MALEPGTVIGSYTIESLLGAGGMGEVYRARDDRLDRVVALKTLPAGVDREAERLARFEREARSASALNHPNIVTIHELGSHDGSHFIAMELVEGESLRAWLEGRRPAWRELIPIFSQIADALATAHEAGIVHRDLKPDNVMITEDERVKVLDFGLAKLSAAPEGSQSAIQTASVHTAEGAILGTPAYMSPEQIRGEAVDYRADQFALGIIMYEMLTGRRPFAGGSTMDELASILNRDAPSLHSLAPEIPLPLAWVVARCLQKRPAERYGATRDLFKDLRNLATTDPERIVASAHRPVAKRNPAWVIGAIILAIAATAAGWLLGSRPSSSGERVPLQLSIELPENLSIPLPEILTAFDLSPDGTRLALTTAGRIWLRSLDRSDWQELPGTEGAMSPEWSPDGSSIAFYSQGKLKRISVDGGPAIDLAEANYNGKPAWGPDGTILFSHIGPDGAGIFAIDEDGSNRRQLTDQKPEGELVHLFPEILPGGKHFLYLAPKATGDFDFTHTVRIVSLETGDQSVLASVPSMMVVSGEDSVVYAREGTLLRQTLDIDAGRLTGEPEPISSPVYTFYSTGIGLFTSSLSGIIVYQRPPAPSRLVWRDRTGKKIGDLGEPARYQNFSISPDGQHVAAAIDDPTNGGSDIWLYDLERRTANRLTHDPVDELYPAWSADGNRVMFRSDANGPPNIHSIDLSERSDQQILRRTFTMDRPYAGHPSLPIILSGTIARATGWDVLEQNADGTGEPEPILASRFHESNASYDPSGRWIAHQSDDSGRLEVYVLERATGRRVRISPSGGAAPRWARNGRELLYVEQGERLVRVAADPERGNFGTPEPLFALPDQGWYWDVTPDGERFLFLAAPPAPDTLAVMIP